MINSSATNYTHAGGASTVHVIAVNDGDVLEVEYYSGSWDGENTIEVRDATGAVVFTDGPTPSTGLQAVGTASCPACTPPSGLAASNVTETTADLSFTAGSVGSTYTVSMVLQALHKEPAQQ